MKNSYLKTLSRIIRYNLKTLIQFEFLFKFILSLIFLPAAAFCFNTAIKISGFTYLSLENITDFLLNPLSLLMLIVLIIFLTSITMLDISALIFLFDASYNRCKIGIKELIKASVQQCGELFRFKNFSVAFLVLFLIPFLNIGVGSNVIASIRIPEFILDFIESNEALFLFYFIIYIILVSLFSRWLYSLHYMVLEDKDFKSARIASKNLIKRNTLKDYLKILLVQILLSFLYILFLLSGLLIIFLFNQKIGFLTVKSTLIAFAVLFIASALIVFANISNGLSYAVLSCLFYKHKIEKKEEIIPVFIEKKEKNSKKKKFARIFVSVISALVLLCFSGLTAQVLDGKADLNIQFVRNTEITAHRGASAHYPENTMSAFEGAKNFKADWIELDVQQTKDREIIVFHDYNLSRITGLNKEISELTYEEIRNLDAGSFFNEKFSDERIPLLSDVLKFASDNQIKLNIELKPSGKETDFEKQIIELIKAYNFEEQCVVTSQNYQVLIRIKNLDPNIKTVYVMSIAIGNITDAQYADAFSVEAANVNKALVDQVHASGKEIYAWTVNTEESINRMIDLNVDNIITDNIELGKNLIERSKSSNLIDEFFKMLQ